MEVASVTVSPSVLRWARESSGYSIDYVSSRTKLSQTQIKEWEETQSEIPFSIVEKLAKVFKRPTIVLLKDTPPNEPANPPYFRKSGSKMELSPEARLTIRRARNLQRISKELIENLDLRSVHEFDESLLERSPEQVAEEQRKTLGISYEEQVRWKDYSEALKKLKNHIEKRKIFVFQIRMPIEQMQGLSLIDDIAPAILLNSKDIPQRRIFTLLHEYAHILVGSPGVCADIDDHVDNNRGLEAWCNRFAGAFLVPKKELLEIMHKKSLSGKVNYEVIRAIAKHFHVSNHMIFVRLQVGQLIPEEDIQSLGKIFKNSSNIISKKTAGRKEGKQKGGVPQYRKILSERGTQFVNLVLENESKKKIPVRSGPR